MSFCILCKLPEQEDHNCINSLTRTLSSIKLVNETMNSRVTSLEERLSNIENKISQVISFLTRNQDSSKTNQDQVETIETIEAPEGAGKELDEVIETISINRVSILKSPQEEFVSKVNDKTVKFAQDMVTTKLYEITPEEREFKKRVKSQKDDNDPEFTDIEIPWINLEEWPSTCTEEDKKECELNQIDPDRIIRKAKERGHLNPILMVKTSRPRKAEAKLGVFGRDDPKPSTSRCEEPSNISNIDWAKEMAKVEEAKGHPYFHSNNFNTKGHEPKEFLQILVEYQGDTYDVQVQRNATTSDLRHAIRRRIGLDHKELLHLFKLEHREIPMSNTQTLWSMGFRHRPNYLFIAPERIDQGDLIRFKYDHKGPNNNGTFVSRYKTSWN